MTDDLMMEMMRGRSRTPMSAPNYGLGGSAAGQSGLRYATQQASATAPADYGLGGSAAGLSGMRYTTQQAPQTPDYSRAQSALQRDPLLALDQTSDK